jgi:ubiquinone/menaquinone biosynthesis C-methylase UbiE
LEVNQNMPADDLKTIIGPADIYERDKVPGVFLPLANLFLEHLPIEKGAAVLDVACGTGIVARMVSERVGVGGSVVAVDIDPDMIAVAKANTPSNASISWHVSSAEDMSILNDGSFDWVLCQQGYQYIADKALALGEMYRVLKPDGRLAMILWRSVDKHNQPKPWAEAEALKKHVSAEAGEKRLKRAAYYDGDNDHLRAQIQNAGFGELNIYNDLFIIYMEVLEELVTEDDYPDLDPETRSAVVSDVRTALEPFRTGNGSAVPYGYHLVTASK